jgi:hypothetical protein
VIVFFFLLVFSSRPVLLSISVLEIRFLTSKFLEVPIPLLYFLCIASLFFWLRLNLLLEERYLLRKWLEEIKGPGGGCTAAPNISRTNKVEQQDRV